MHRLGKDADYQLFLTNLRKSESDTQTTQFLLDGPRDIQSEKDIQDYVAQTTYRVDEFRRTMQALNGQSLSIHLNTDLKRAWNSDQHVQCTVTETSDGVYDSDCDASHAATIDLDAADFKALALSAAGAQVYMTVLNGWNATGVIDQSLAQKNQPSVPSDVVFQKLLSNPQFGHMRDTATIGVLPDLGRDLIAGVRYARAEQAQLCKTGDENQINRVGHLFEKGFCTQSSDVTDAQLRALDASLSGTPTLLSFQSGESMSSHLVDLRKLFTNSLRDVRSYFPVQKDGCDQIVAINNSTFDGAFQAGDVNQILAQAAAANCHVN